MSGAPGPPTGPNQGASNRRSRIVGPTSALTDYLAQHNISAGQIRIDAERRRVNAHAATARAEAEARSSALSAPPTASESDVVAAETTLSSKKRKSKVAKGPPKKGPEDTDDDDAQDAASQRRSKRTPYPDPRQKANCQICEQELTVTAYTASAPDGNGFLCLECAKDFESQQPKRQKRATQGRKIRSNALDLISNRGSKSLMVLCVETLAKNVDMADDLGDLPFELTDRVAALLSKKRLITSENVNLFLQPTHDTINVYDCAKLTPDDFIRMFQVVPKVKSLRIRNCVQFKNAVMDYLLASPVQLENLNIHGANLVDSEHWSRFIIEKGRYLRRLKVCYTDNYFGDEQLKLLKLHCPDLVQLKIAHNQQVTSAGLVHIAQLKNLEHLTLEIYQPTDSPPYIEILNAIGANLRSLCLRRIEYLEDAVLAAIHDNCTQLRKLALTLNHEFHDAAFAALFTNWRNPPLAHLDLGKCRHLDSYDPEHNAVGIGLGSAGFVALMRHSGLGLRYLNVCDCRHISRDAFKEAFAPGSRYLRLATVDLSFCWGVNDDVIEAVFRSTHRGALKALKTFGNFKVTDLWSEENIPAGVFLIGLPAGNGMHIEGHGKALAWDVWGV